MKATLLLVSDDLSMLAPSKLTLHLDIWYTAHLIIYLVASYLTYSIIMCEKKCMSCFFSTGWFTECKSAMVKEANFPMKRHWLGPLGVTLRPLWTQSLWQSYSPWDQRPLSCTNFEWLWKLFRPWKYQGSNYIPIWKGSLMKYELWRN
jgi:hypothetical protein